MKVTKIKARQNGKPCLIYVSELLEADNCDDFKKHQGYWWCQVGGYYGHFSLKRPKSGCSVLNLRDANIFMSEIPIMTKEQFENLILN